MKISDKKFTILSKIINNDHSVEVKIRSFSELMTGWHFGEGGPISDEVIAVTLELSKYARGLDFSEIDAFPGANGEILLTIYHGTHVLELTIEPDLSIDAVIEVENIEISEKEGLSVIGAKEEVQRFKEK